MLELILKNYNYYIGIVLMMIGLWAMISKNNLIKKLIGMSIFQTSIILFYLSTGAKTGSTIPILAHESHEIQDPLIPLVHAAVDATLYSNPLPHVLMLTAIVVGVATTGLALAVTLRIYQEYQSIEEDEILERITNDR